MELSTDGDLWEVLVRHLIAKGPHCVKATWVKGHATDEHVAKGLTNIVCREGNNHADQLADLGVEIHGIANIDLARIYAARLHIYNALMQAVHTHILLLMACENEARAREQRMAERFGIGQPSNIQLLSISNCIDSDLTLSSGCRLQLAPPKFRISWRAPSKGSSDKFGDSFHSSISCPLKLDNKVSAGWNCLRCLSSRVDVLKTCKSSKHVLPFPGRICDKD